MSSVFTTTKLSAEGRGSGNGNCDQNICDGGRVRGIFFSIFFTFSSCHFGFKDNSKKLDIDQ